MRYTLDLIVVSIGIIGIFQLVSILTFLVYSYIFLCMYAYYSNSINFDWYLIFHTYMCFICAYYIPISLSTNHVYTKAWASTLFQLIWLSIGILIRAYALFLLVFHKGGEHFVFEHPFIDSLFWTKRGEEYVFISFVLFLTPLLMIDKKGEKNLSLYAWLYACLCFY